MRASFGRLAAFLAVTACTLPAHAEPIEKLIPRLIIEGGWLQAHYPGDKPGEKPGEKGPAPKGAASPDHRPALVQSNPPPPEQPPDLLGSDVHVAVVARDWQQAFSLTDGRSLLFDRIRMIRSSRMAVVRVVSSGGRILPYAEASFGQWRPDTDIVPWLRADLDTASQVALGVQVHLGTRCVFAWDAERTQIFFATNAPVTRVTASFAALRAEF